MKMFVQFCARVYMQTLIWNVHLQGKLYIDVWMRAGSLQIDNFFLFLQYIHLPCCPKVTPGSKIKTGKYKINPLIMLQKVLNLQPGKLYHVISLCLFKAFMKNSHKPLWPYLVFHWCNSPQIQINSTWLSSTTENIWDFSGHQLKLCSWYLETW